MKLTNEERELIKSEYNNFTERYTIYDVWTAHSTEEVSDFWLSKIDTILEEREKKTTECPSPNNPCMCDCHPNDECYDCKRGKHKPLIK